MSTEVPMSSERHGTVDMVAWSARNGVIRCLLPMNRRKVDPLDVFDAVTNTIPEDAPLKQKVSSHTVYKHFGEPLNGEFAMMDAMFRLHGAWRLKRKGVEGRSLWVNPGYVHLSGGLPRQEYATSISERVRVIRKWAHHGTVSKEQVAKRCMMDESEFEAFLSEQGIPWEEWQERGVRRVARTVKVIYRWGDRDVEEIASAMGFETEFVEQLLESVSEWVVPVDPTTHDPNR